MKLAVFSESTADEAAIRILTDALLGQPSEAVGLPSLRGRGWNSVVKLLRSVMLDLYFQTDADGLVVILDSDRSPVHVPAHDEPGKAVDKCRLCELRKREQAARRILQGRPERGLLRVAFGLAVPSLEAWLRCGCDPHVTEAAWIVAQRDKRLPYDVPRLKESLYGRERYDLAHETRRMTEEATRIAQDISRLETTFPYGFGSLGQTVRGWLADGQ